MFNISSLFSARGPLRRSASKTSGFAFGGKNTIILVVEDEPDMRQALSDSLRHEKFDVIEAANGREGLDRAFEHNPDLIVLDILMPKMDGMEMMKQLRQYNSWGRAMPIILLTNLSADDKIMHGIVENEPSYYLVKSDWKIPNVIEKVRELLAERER